MHRLPLIATISAALMLMTAAPAHALLGLTLDASTQPAINVTGTTATLTGDVSPLSLSTSYYFEIGIDDKYGTQTPVTYVTSLLSSQTVSATVVGLKPKTTYHYRLVAGELLSTVRGKDVNFKTAASSSGGTAPVAPGSGSTVVNPGGGSSGTGSATDPAGNGGDAPASTGDFPADFNPPTTVTPVLGESVGAAPAAGDVLVRLAGSKMFVPLQGEAELPVGSVIDTRAGTVTLVSAVDSAGATQPAQFQGAVFQVRQADQSTGMTDIYLRSGDFRPCWPETVRGVVASRKKRKTVRRLWGRDRGGRFRTHGQRSVATVRGTTWSVADRCDGTVTKVTDGAVSVYDRGTRKNVLVTAGRSYLARAKR